MACKKLRTKALWEQDRWLSYLAPGPGRRVTREQRLEFLRFDSHGGESPVDNPILAGKLAARAIGDSGWFPNPDELLEIYSTDYWPGGYALMEDYLRRVCGISPLRKAFGDEAVARWLTAFLRLPWGRRLVLKRMLP